MNDFPGIAAAFVLFSALTFFPGYVLAHALDVWSFRNRTFAFQIAASVSLSLATGPVLTFLAGTAAWWLYAGTVVCGVWLLWRKRPALDRTVRRAAFVASAWSLFAAVWLMDWQFSGRSYFPVYALDYSTRAAMVHSLAVFGLPAQTPFFNPGHPVSLHYHFLWLLQCALIHSLAPKFMPARLCFIAGAVWCGIGLMCVAALAMRLWMNRRSWVVIGLLAVTGLDIIPALLILLGNALHLLHMLPPSAEWWNEQVDGWIYTVLWEPHYICALVACVTGWLLLWDQRRWPLAFVSAMCFATAVGSGSFVALVFAASLGVWMLFHVRQSRLLVLSGALSVLVALPYLLTLRGPSQNVGGPSLLQFTIRPFLPLPLPALADLALLPLNYFLELGVFAACLWIGYRRKLARHEWMLLLMATTAILICTFVKSAATPNNDLGWRGFLVAQFALLLLAAEYLETTKPNRGLKALLVLGLLGTGYDLLLTRLFPILSDANLVPKLKWLAVDENLGQRTLANRQAYEWVGAHTDATATIGQNPDVDAVDLFSGLYSDRRIVAGDRTCTSGFGGSAHECAPVIVLEAQLFRGAADLSAVCDVLPADLYIVRDTDPAWRRRTSWVWTESPVFANQFVRIYACGKSKERSQ